MAPVELLPVVTAAKEMKKALTLKATGKAAACRQEFTNPSSQTSRLTVRHSLVSERTEGGTILTAEGSSENRTEQHMEGDGLMGTEASSKMSKLSHSEVTRASMLLQAGRQNEA